MLLDSEALSSLAHGPASRRNRVRALMVVARRRGEPVATSAALLAEVIRGRPSDSAVHSALNREAIEVHPVHRGIGVRAGQLLGMVRAGSELAMDALLVATAELSGGARIATTDAGDLRRLATRSATVTVVDVG